MQDTSHISIMWKHILSNSLSNVIVVNQVSGEDRGRIWDLSSSPAFTSLEQVFLNFWCPVFAFVQVAKDFLDATGFLSPDMFTLYTWKSHLGRFWGLHKFVWAFQMCGSCREQTLLNWLLHACELWMSALWAHTAHTWNPSKEQLCVCAVLSSHAYEVQHIWNSRLDVDMAVQSGPCFHGETTQLLACRLYIPCSCVLQLLHM